ncbi:MBL fold metallo-hydrolase [Arenicella sp. 4NH20-0111]|uniref:MBL fold metallo-hydrolase n=1 Tax=Arenicella sp. 4NH20-0111 TaxID=3127648 RepID=UPI00310A2CEE
MREYIPDSNIYTVDALYYQEQLASIHIIRDGDRLSIIDTGTQFSVPQLKTAIDALGLSFDNVDYIILTHIHLDHAGGASSLMALCSNAELVVHPKGARHMIDPSKLVAGAMAVYGDTEFNRLYGTIGKIDPSRVIQPQDGETLPWKTRPLTFIDTPGHANHHHCIIEHESNAIFTGDTLGIGYRALRSEGHAFVMPTTTPVQFNPEALHHSIDKVMEYNPDTLYLTHYSALTPNQRMISGLHEQIDDFVMLTQQAAEGDEASFETRLASSITEYLVRRCSNELPTVDKTVIDKWIGLDANLNAQGLAFWWQRKHAA